MLDRATQKLMQAEDKTFGIAPGFKQFSPYPYAGMNAEASRQGMDDKEFFLIENFIKIGDGNLRTLWDEGGPLYAANGGTSIVYFKFYNIGATPYVAVFLDDGTAVQVDMLGNITQISSTPGLFYNGGQLPVAGQYGSQYLLIANNLAANDYWIWDGSVFYGAGTLAPQITLTDGGANYTSSPTVVAYGGSGTGATFLATVNNGSVVNVQETNPGSGYEPGDQVQLLFTGGGSDDGIELVAVLTAGTIQAIEITNPGSGYTPGTYALGFSGGGGTGAAGTYTVDSTDKVVSTVITNPGSGYTGTPTVSFASGGGSAAAGIAILSAGSVASITVVNGGTNLTGTPTITIVGGNGTGATATANLTTGSITSVTITDGGINYTSTPAVVVQSGLNNAATANITLMPFGVSGSAIETFQSRVWLTFPNQVGNQQNGGTFFVSAPGSITDFATSDGGDVFTSSDAFLRSQFYNIKQSNGYLYTLADSSVSVISNVQTSGSPSETTFNYQNTDPQTGTSWRDSVEDYSRTILFANAFGVFGLYGGAVTKISMKMDNVFNDFISPDLGGITPTSATANIFNQKVFLLNMTISDPITFQPRTIMLGWNEREWMLISQGSSYTFIGTQEVNSDLTAWGTDGTFLTPLFSAQSDSLPKRLSSKLYGQSNMLVSKQALGVYVQAQDLSTNKEGVVFNAFTTDAEHGSYAIPDIVPFPSTPPPYYAILSMNSGDVAGQNLGFTLESTSPDFTLNYVGLGHIEVSSIAMSSSSINGQIQTE